MPNLNAALGTSQIKTLNVKLKKKRSLFNEYLKIFKLTDNFYVFREPKNCKSNYWLQTIVIKSKNIDNRKNIISYFKSKKIEVRPIWKVLTSLKFLKSFPKMKIQEAFKLEKKLLNFPSSSYL